MTRLAPQKIELLNSLVSEISRNYARGRVIVAVDGIADTAEFADDLAEALKNAGRAAFRASMRNFREPRVLRYSAGSLPTSDTYDIETLHRVLIDPFRDGGTGSFVLAAYDAERDAPIEPKWITAKADALLIVDGASLHTAELRGLWHYSIWLAPHNEPDAVMTRYIKQVKPQALATAIVDASDQDRPRRLFADSC